MEIYSHNDADNILKRKNTLLEINEVAEEIASIKPLTSKKANDLFKKRGWNTEIVLLLGTAYRQDAFKDRVLVEIDLRWSVIDAVHRNFLRAQELYNRGIIDVLIQITGIEYEPQFDKVKRDIEQFKSVLTVPIYLIGLGL